MTYLIQSPKPAHEQSTDLPLEPLLNSLAKALKALTFYPAGHPQRNESVAAAYRQIAPFIGNRELVLLWSRDGCSVDENPDLKSRSVTAKALTREMLSRKLQRLAILPDVTEKDLLAFLTLISTEAATIHAGGGIEKEMVRAGIRTIGANEVDLSALRGLQEEPEPEEEEPDNGISETEVAEPEIEAEEPQDIQLSILELDILLGMLKAEKNDHQYLQLAREVIDAVEALKRQEAFESLLPALETLLDEYASESRTVTQKEYIRYVLEQIASDSMTTFLLDKIEERSAGNEALLDRVC